MTPEESRALFGTPADMDETRVWGIYLKTESGQVRKYRGEQAFWGTEEQAEKILQTTVEQWNMVKEDKVLQAWKTDETDEE